MTFQTYYRPSTKCERFQGPGSWKWWAIHSRSVLHTLWPAIHMHTLGPFYHVVSFTTQLLVFPLLFCHVHLFFTDGRFHHVASCTRELARVYVRAFVLAVRARRSQLVFGVCWWRWRSM